VQDTSLNVPDRYPDGFLRAVARVLADEGGYVCDPSDPGGETRFGISRRAYPALDIRDLTREQAVAIYFRDYWRGRRYGELPGAVAEKVFDLAVNAGPENAVRCLQRALRACARAVADDGELGPVTIDAARAAAPDSLLAALRSETAGHYRLLAALWPGEHGGARCEFLTGWLNRAYE
jgi:lysozyme family protein